MIRKKTLPAQEELWVARDQIKRSKGSTYYDRLAADLDKEGFGDHVRKLCEPYYTSRRYIFGISFPVRYTCLSSAVFFSDDHT